MEEVGYQKVDVFVYFGFPSFMSFGVADFKAYGRALAQYWSSRVGKVARNMIFPFHQQRWLAFWRLRSGG